MKLNISVVWLISIVLTQIFFELTLNYHDCAIIEWMPIADFSTFGKNKMLLFKRTMVIFLHSWNYNWIFVSQNCLSGFKNAYVYNKTNAIAQISKENANSVELIIV